MVRAAAIAAALTLAAQARAAWPTPPAWWLHQAACIRAYESTGRYDALGYVNGVLTYYGAYQFLAGTWASVGGHGSPARATPGEQTWRAWLVYRRDGGSWREWGTAHVCGLS